jgi:hypothetical protein
VNSSACEAYGYARSDFARLTLDDLVEESDAVQALTTVDDSLCAGDARTVELRAAAATARASP